MKKYFSAWCLLSCLALSPAFGAEPESAPSFSSNVGEETEDQLSLEVISGRFVAGDYAGLEQLRKKLWSSKSRLSSGELKLEKFYEAFDSIPSAQLEMVIAQAEDWRSSAPDSYLSALLLGKFRRDLAWKIRSSHFVGKLTQEQKDGFRTEMVKAIDLFLQASQSGDLDPEVYTELMGSLSATGRSEEANQYLEKLRALEPSYLRGLRNYMTYLLPQWGSQPGEAERFADQSAKTSRAVFGDGMYALLGAKYVRNVVDSYRDQVFSEEKFSWLRMREGFHELMKRFPSEKSYPYLFARTAVYANDFDAAAEMFQQTGTEWNETAQLFFNDQEMLQRFVEAAVSRKPLVKKAAERKAPTKGPYALYAQGKMVEARQAYELEVEEAKKSGNLRRQWSALLSLAWFHGVTGNFRAGIDVGNKALEIAEQLNQPYYQGRTLAFIGLYLSSMGYYEAAVETFERAIEIAAPNGKPVIVPVWGLATQELGRVMFQMGNIPEARRLIGETLDFARQHGIQIGIAEGATELSQVALSQGNVSEAVKLAQEGYEASVKCNCNNLNTAKAILAYAQALLLDVGTDQQRLQEALHTVIAGEQYAASVGARPILAQLKMVHGKLLPPSAKEERQKLLEEAVQLSAEMEHESRGDAEAALGGMYLQGREVELAKFYLKRGIALNEQMFRNVANAHLMLDSAAISKLEGKDAEAVRKLTSAYEAALKTEQLSLQFDTAVKLAQEYSERAFTRLAVQWGERALLHAEQLLKKDASPERKRSIQETAIALQEIVIAGSAQTESRIAPVSESE